jgi:heme A synthase
MTVPTPPPSAPAQGSYVPYAAQAPSRTNVLAIVSLVTAFVVSLAAIITGHIALAQIKRTGEKGRGLALAGVILGYAGIALGTLVIVANILLAVAAATSGEYTGAY